MADRHCLGVRNKGAWRGSRGRRSLNLVDLRKTIQGNSEENAKRATEGLSHDLRLGAENFAAPRQPVRHEVVTHLLGTLCYLCLRAGQWANMAEREGFEPPIGLHLCRISSAVHSTTLPPLRGAEAAGWPAGLRGVFYARIPGETRRPARRFWGDGREIVPSGAGRAGDAVNRGRRARVSGRFEAGQGARNTAAAGRGGAGRARWPGEGESAGRSRSEGRRGKRQA